MRQSAAPMNRRMAALEDSAQKTVRMLVRRPDVRVVVGGDACYVHRTKTLYLPSYRHGEIKDARLTRAFAGLTDHECAHVEFTDFDALDEAHERWKGEFGEQAVARVHHLWNTFEDRWIEAAWVRLYPGSRWNIQTMNEYMYEKTGGAAVCDPSFRPKLPDGTLGPPIGMWGAFCQTINRVGLGAASLDEVSEACRKVWEFCADEIQQGLASSSTREAIAAAEAVWRKLLLSGQTPPPQPELSLPGAFCGDAEFHDDMREFGPQLIGGDWGELPPPAHVIGADYRAAAPPEYTVHPRAREADRVVKYGPLDRRRGRSKLSLLESAAGPATQQLMGLLRGAVQASRQSLTIGGMEDGDELDDGALAGIALGTERHAIFNAKVQQITESTYVCVLVDCSGSMGSSRATGTCTACGRRADQLHCACGAPVKLAVHDRAGYAAITAMALHKALQGVRIPHAVLGYTTGDRRVRFSAEEEAEGNPCRPGTPYRTWSRMSSALEIHEFVPSPGLVDDGAAIPFIDGRRNNLDGESVLWAARYAAMHGGDYDRVLLLVIADGLPWGADCSEIQNDYLASAVETVARAGIEVYGIGVAIDERDVFAQFYPDRGPEPGRAPTGAVHIESGQGLTARVLRELTALLTRGWGMTRRHGGR